MRIDLEKNLLVGHEPIDREHRGLADRINEIFLMLESRADRDRLDAAFQELFAVMAGHFSNEERMMTDRQYPDMPIHAFRHNRLLLELQERARITIGAFDDDLSDSIAFIEDWFSFHIKTDDTKLAAFLNSRHQAVQS